jgi:hypothetical protein
VLHCPVLRTFSPGLNPGKESVNIATFNVLGHLCPVQLRVKCGFFY